MLWYFLLQVGPPGASRCGLLFMWINTHTLSNTAFNISPFFAGPLHTSPNAHDAFFFSFTEIVYQTHCISSFPGPVRLDAPDPTSVMPNGKGWKLLASSSGPEDGWASGNGW
jgi:hypothetical protein